VKGAAQAALVGAPWRGGGLRFPAGKKSGEERRTNILPRSFWKRRRERKYASLRANGEHVDTVEIGAVGSGGVMSLVWGWA
jgi:hypothetical protein